MTQYDTRCYLILKCAQKLVLVSLIYHTNRKLKSGKKEKLNFMYHIFR